MDIVKAIEIAQKLTLLAIRVIRSVGAAMAPDGSPARIEDDETMAKLLEAQGLTDAEVKDIMGR